MLEQTLEISRTLSMASQAPLRERDLAQLHRLGRDLLKNRDVVAVAFFDIASQRLALASEDPDLEKSGLGFPISRISPADLSRPHVRYLPSLGQFVEVTAPVICYPSRGSVISMEPSADNAIAGAAARPGPRLVGYATVCVSQSYTEAAFHRARLSVILISGTVLLVAMPIGFTLIHRLLDPVRRLVAATDRVAAGDLEAHVDVDRKDLIGTLALSFNRMAQRVREQQSPACPGE